jgi:hypothetical protein
MYCSILHSAAARRYLPPFYGCNPTLAMQLRYRVHSVFCEFVENMNIVVSFYHTMVVKHCLQDDENETQLKCKM